MARARRSLAEIKKALNDATNSGGNQNSDFSNYFPFFRMDFGEKAIIRFLPDKNEDNPLGFLIEKKMHILTVNGQEKRVPCLSMYGKDCPVCEAAKKFYKEEGETSVTGKRLYRKRQHVGQALVIEDPLKYKADETPMVGTVKLVNISYTLMEKIDEAFKDDELVEVPDDYDNGTDFIIKKTEKGNYANYGSSKFDRNPRSLTEQERAVAEEGIIDLSTVIPREPELSQVEAWLDADLNGTPVGSVQSNTSRSAPPSPTGGLTATPASTATPTTNVEATTSVAEATTAPAPGLSATTEADSILETIRKKRAAAAATQGN